MFSSKPATPSTGLSINTNSANSLFGGNSNQATNTTSTPGSTGASGGLFGTATQQPKPAGSLFGNTGATNTQQSQPSGSNMFSGLGGQQNSTSGGGLFGNTTANTTQQQSGGLFSGSSGASNTTTQAGNTGGLFGNTGAASTSQAQSKPFSLGGSTTGGIFGGTASNAGQQQQQQQPAKPTLSLFGNQNSTAQQPAQQTTTTTPGAGTVIPGVKVDISNLLPTTKYESCADEVKAELERFDTFVLNQINMCNEVANLVPSVAAQGGTIPNDVEYVQGKLETMQHALENDASDIDQLRTLVTRDAAEAQVAFRAIDTLKLPLQYQSTGGSGWWSAQDQKVSDPQLLRSTRKNTLALPDDVEGDPSASSINGVPVNLVEYFSQRSDEMGIVLERYTRNLKEIEDHLHGVESTLERQIHDFTTSRNRDSTGGGAPKSILNDLAAVLADVETGILGVASRLGTVTEQAQEVVLGAPSGLRQV